MAILDGCGSIMLLHAVSCVSLCNEIKVSVVSLHRELLLKRTEHEENISTNTISYAAQLNCESWP